LLVATFFYFFILLDKAHSFLQCMSAILWSDTSEASQYTLHGHMKEY